MYDNYTFVEVPQEYGKDVLKAMKNVKIKGKSVNVEAGKCTIEDKTVFGGGLLWGKLQMVKMPGSVEKHSATDCYQ